MSALGHERTSRHVRIMSALPLKADIHMRGLQVCLVPIADIGELTYLNWLVADQTDPLRVNQACAERCSSS